MNRILTGLLLATFTSIPVFAALEAGMTAPQFDARASLGGEEFHYSLSDALASGPVVVYFYPSAYTRGCNIQAHEFAVHMRKFNAVGASVIGVSLDSIERLNDFSADPEYCAGKLAVASDASGEIAKSFDIKVRDHRKGFKDTRGVKVNHGTAERTTFIVSSDGEISDVIGGLSPRENVQRSLEAVQDLN